jgi:elongation factor Ts
MTIELTSKLIGTLRERTGLPLMKCKKALVETTGDYSFEEMWFNAAIEWLRKNGEEAVNKMAGRSTPCGRIGQYIEKDHAAMIFLGCQTDFVANSDEFKLLVTKCLDIIKASPHDAENNYNKQMVLVGEAIFKLGENIVINRRIVFDVNEKQVVAGYNHDGRIGVLVSGLGDKEKLRQVALHVASANPEPLSISESDIDPYVLEKEKDIILAQPDMQGKPDAIKLKMLDGRLKRFYKEKTLLSQAMLFDTEATPNNKETVGQYLKRHNLTLISFTKYSV